jgi:hypothetical protein
VCVKAIAREMANETEVEQEGILGINLKNIESDPIGREEVYKKRSIQIVRWDETRGSPGKQEDLQRQKDGHF